VTSGTAAAVTDTLRLTTSAITFLGDKVWYEGNDGTGSGLDADLLDGEEGSAYAKLAGATFTGNIDVSSHQVRAKNLYINGVSGESTSAANITVFSDSVSFLSDLTFKVTANGNVTNYNNSYGSISDVKLKENIIDAGSQWDDFKAVRFRKYNFIADATKTTHLGVVAQELEAVSPGLIDESPDLDADGNELETTTKSVKHSILTLKALVALQEAMARIETLEARLDAFESLS
jgi:hypothetical protein